MSFSAVWRSKLLVWMLVSSSIASIVAFFLYTINSVAPFIIGTTISMLILSLCIFAYKYKLEATSPARVDGKFSGYLEYILAYALIPISSAVFSNLITPYFQAKDEIAQSPVYHIIVNRDSKRIELFSNSKIVQSYSISDLVLDVDLVREKGLKDLLKAKLNSDEQSQKDAIRIILDEIDIQRSRSNWQNSSSLVQFVLDLDPQQGNAMVYKCKHIWENRWPGMDNKIASSRYRIVNELLSRHELGYEIWVHDFLASVNSEMAQLTMDEEEQIKYRAKELRHYIISSNFSSDWGAKMIANPKNESPAHPNWESRIVNELQLLDKDSWQQYKSMKKSPNL